MMNPLLPNIWLYVSVLCLIAILSFVIGSFSLAIFDRKALNEQNTLMSLFKAHSWGYVVIVTFFAIIWTKGNSIMWISLLLLALLYMWNKKENKTITLHFDSNLFKAGSMSLLLFIASFAAFYYLFFIRTGGNIWCDHMFYANVSAHLSTQHIETTNLFTGTHRAATYHWGDLWFTALCGTLFSANFLYILLMVTYPYLISVVILGGIAVANSYLKNIWMAVLWGVSLLFAIPLTNVLIAWEHPVVASLKFVVIYNFILLFLAYYSERLYSYACVALLLLVPFYSTVAPGILTMVCILSLLCISNDKGFVKGVFTNRYIILAVGICGAYCLFYFMQTFIPNDFLLVGEGRTELISAGNPLKEFIFYFVKRVGRGLILFPSVVIIAWISKTWKDDYIHLAIAVWVGLIISCVVGGLLRFKMLDGGQVNSNFQVIMVVICWYAVLVIAKTLKGWTQMLLATVFMLYYGCMMIYAQGGMNYLDGNEQLTEQEILNLNTAKLELEGNSNYKIGYYRNYEIEENKNTHKTRLRMYYPFDIMPHLITTGYYAPICLSAVDIPLDVLPLWNEQHMSILYNYLSHTMDSTLMQDEKILDFIEEQNIGYVVIEHDASLPKYLIDKADSITSFKGDVLYKLKCN